MISDLEILAEIENNGVLDEMLIAGANVMVKAQKHQIDIQNIISDSEESGTLKASITAGKVKKTKDGKALYVYPKGERTREYKTGPKKGQTYKVRNAEIAFITEFGAPRRGIAARPFMLDAINENGNDAISAEMAVFDKWFEQTLKK